MHGYRKHVFKPTELEQQLCVAISTYSATHVSARAQAPAELQEDVPPLTKQEQDNRVPPEHSMPKDIIIAVLRPPGAISDDMAVFEEHSDKQQPLDCLFNDMTQAGFLLQDKSRDVSQSPGTQIPRLGKKGEKGGGGVCEN